MLKPFLKWAGGKTQLLETIIQNYPKDLGKNINKYAEPFIGGGAVLFDILSKYDLEKVYISDINPELINTYKMIKKYPILLIENLLKIQQIYINFELEERKKYFYDKRTEFNFLKKDNINAIEIATLFIFLNKTCFNGLYRVNQEGLFNVPMGSYKNPCICDEENIMNVSRALKNVEIICADYKKAKKFIDKNTFVYFDPPYRPITKKSSFTAYSKNSFNDLDQKKLALFFDEMNAIGAKVLLSNSDPKNIDSADVFFDKLYEKYFIRRIKASRMINSKADRRGYINELLISNYEVLV